MRESEIRAIREKGNLGPVKILRSPTQTRMWILLFKEPNGKSFFLVSDNDEMRSYSTVDDAVETLHSLGFSRAEILF